MEDGLETVNVVATRRHKAWLKSAQKLTKLSQFPSYRMASMIVKGKPISYGINKTSPGYLKDKLYDKSKRGFGLGTHAEMASILNAVAGDLKGSEIYIAGNTKAGNTICSRPCQRCLRRIKEAGIKRIVYHEQNGEVIVLEFV